MTLWVSAGSWCKTPMITALKNSGREREMENQRERERAERERGREREEERGQDRDETLKPILDIRPVSICQAWDYPHLSVPVISPKKGRRSGVRPAT